MSLVFKFLMLPRLAFALCFVFTSLPVCTAETISLTGLLLNPEDAVSVDFTLATPGPVALQTYGFGGGINADGNTISPGGFDPFVGLFSNTGGGALFVNGTSDILSNYSSGCPPAGTVTIGAIPKQCGDVSLVFGALPAGSYKVLLTDGEYLSTAVFEAAPAFLADGFTDLSGGVFQTCYGAANCNTDTANWALDISAPAGTFSPEPSSLTLVGFGIAVGLGIRCRTISKQKGDL
jgi:hypothetical protein